MVSGSLHTPSLKKERKKLTLLGFLTNVSQGRSR